MENSKIKKVAIVACRQCPYYQYGGVIRHRCAHHRFEICQCISDSIVDGYGVPHWCPLENYYPDKKRFLRVGDYIEVTPSMKIYTDIKHEVGSKNGLGGGPKYREYISNDTILAGEKFSGEYFVRKAEWGGGGCCGSCWPDGYRIWAVNEKTGVEISFHQSGAFESVIHPGQIKILRSMPLGY